MHQMMYATMKISRGNGHPVVLDVVGQKILGSGVFRSSSLLFRRQHLGTCATSFLLVLVSDC